MILPAVTWIDDDHSLLDKLELRNIVIAAIFVYPIQNIKDGR